MTIAAVIDSVYAEIAASNPGGGIPPPVAPPLRIQLVKVIQDLTKYTEASIKLTVLETTAILIEDTPKDTTWASVSWFPGYGQGLDNSGYLVDPDEFEFEGQSIADLVDLDIEAKIATRRDGQEQAIASFARTRIFINQYVARSPELTNGTPYIEELNRGSSSQASAGFVERALNVGLLKLEARATVLAGGRRVRFI